MIRRVFLDMDGVLADFVGHILTEEEHAKYLTSKTRKMNLAAWLGISEIDLWHRTAGDPDWWSNIPPLPHYESIMPVINDTLSCLDTPMLEFYVMTHPQMTDTRCIYQKMRWVNLHMPADSLSGFIPTKHKHLLAKDDTLLIDDCPHNVSRFRDEGGHAILYPSKCNELHVYSNDPIPFLRHQLEMFV